MFLCSPFDMRSPCRSRKYSKILDLTVREHSSCFPFPIVLRFVYIIYRVATQGFLFHWNGEFSSVCWFAIHILHGRLLIKKRTEQISVLLFEWTREKHNSIGLKGMCISMLKFRMDFTWTVEKSFYHGLEFSCFHRLVVRRPHRERKIPGSNPACAGIFSGSSHTGDLKIGTPVATLPEAWRYRVSAGTGQPGVSILWLGELESWICNFYLSVAARKIVWADPSLRYTRMLLGR